MGSPECHRSISMRSPQHQQDEATCYRGMQHRASLNTHCHKGMYVAHTADAQGYSRALGYVAGGPHHCHVSIEAKTAEVFSFNSRLEHPMIDGRKDTREVIQPQVQVEVNEVL